MSKKTAGNNRFPLNERERQPDLREGQEKSKPIKISPPPDIVKKPKKD